MGQAKAEMMRREDLVSLATDVAVRAGALERCDAHDEVVIDLMDDDAKKRAYAIGTNMVKAGEVDGSREEFMDAIKSAIESAGDECYSCNKYLND